MYSNLEFFFRWLHVLAGIAWIGHLYFFNFVNVPLQGALDDAAKKAVNPKLMPRALWWFRWGAMATFLAGLALFAMIYMYTPGVGFGPSAVYRDTLSGSMTDRAGWIMLGMLLGFVMWFNVWFVIWPAQKGLLSGSVPQERAAATRARAGRFSRINTYLSGPMLFGMLAPNHFFGAFDAANVLILLAVGAAAIWAAIFHSSRVGQSV